MVFGGGTLLLRGRGADAVGASPGAAAPLPPPAAPSDAGLLAINERVGDEPVAPSDAGPAAADPLVVPVPTGAMGASEVPAAASTGSVVVGPPSISRCFDAGPPTPIAGANCGSLAALQQHIAGRATQLAACGRGGHGRLALVLDFRFSTAFVRGWGSPASTVPRAGDVTSCVKNAVFPLPFASMPHDHDRYLAVVPIDF